MHNLKVLAFRGGMNHLHSKSVAGQSARFTGSCSSPSVKLLKFWQNPDKASDASWLIEQLWSPPAPRPEKVPFCEKRPILWRRVSCADWRRRESFVTFVRPHFPQDCHRPLIQLSPPSYRLGTKADSNSFQTGTMLSHTIKIHREDLKHWEPMVFLNVRSPNYSWLESSTIQYGVCAVMWSVPRQRIQELFLSHYHYH